MYEIMYAWTPYKFIKNLLNNKHKQKIQLPELLEAKYAKNILFTL